ncbi:hypothetical protein F5Y00DRAFT_202097 [Daldinia vernicosa]|uniref:uncharacterized protein n=1 Tax=Daldinia vernicosa TaxID=114800 RepID=UPI002007424F|nr:uncharacterized protein F5Y00DRAFT_202097 [Daldinia vernicosa]KAI0844309.1 hypothetical protein F5Y00DRAFT_202097 [Daldinia vernicosa]
MNVCKLPIKISSVLCRVSLCNALILLKHHQQDGQQPIGHNMRQKRICENFNLSCKHTKSFLHLPPSVRRQVYEEAGLIVGADIVLCRRPPKIWFEERTTEDEDRL